MCLFCFTVLSCECIFYVLRCLMFIDMLHIQTQLMHGLHQWNEYVCIYVYMYKHSTPFYYHIYHTKTHYVDCHITNKN
jgi:hypothetical protein